MGNITYVKGDLFSAPSGVLAHACNCYGSWGGGIARIFKMKFPEAYEQYKRHCAANSPENLLGTCQLITEGNYQIACLFTNDYSTNDEVAQYTLQSMNDLQSKIPHGTKIHMPKINAGIFNVPWVVTESSLKQVSAPIKVYVLD